ncbi:hypothetical protein Hanom_Chr04g00341111 [Helianthus anomalus]
MRWLAVKCETTIIDGRENALFNIFPLLGFSSKVTNLPPYFVRMIEAFQSSSFHF